MGIVTIYLLAAAAAWLIFTVWFTKTWVEGDFREEGIKSPSAETRATYTIQALFPATITAAIAASVWPLGFIGVALWHILRLLFHLADKYTSRSSRH